MNKLNEALQNLSHQIQLYRIHGLVKTGIGLQYKTKQQRLQMKRCCIYGLDTDLIVLSILKSGIKILFY